LLRVFDRYGERRNRQKARMKFLLDDLGLEQMRRLVQEEWTGLPVKEFLVNREVLPPVAPPAHVASPPAGDMPQTGYAGWRATNVVAQKQKGYVGVYVRVPLGNLDVQKARLLAGIARVFAADDIRVTANQGYFLRFVLPEHLPALHGALAGISLADPGFDSARDITACPGTDTCNLGISDSTHIALEFERVLSREYAPLIYDNNIKIKISGCPNSCGQHGLASIGFHGSSFRVGDRSLPALQVVLGGARLGNGEGILSEKVIKVPSRRGPDCLRILLDDFQSHRGEEEYFEEYVRRRGKTYFAVLLRAIADLSNLRPDEFVDWGHDEAFALKTETGECAGVIIDLVATLLEETEEKLGRAREALGERRFADGIYNGYNVFVNGAKALLLARQVIATTQSGVLREFESNFGAVNADRYPGGFAEFVLRINKSEPSEEFARRYIQDAADFLALATKMNAVKPGSAATFT
jgi:sulfite reductase (ferredoxin)